MMQLKLELPPAKPPERDTDEVWTDKAIEAVRRSKAKLNDNEPKKPNPPLS